jgi:hypothetical protein
MKDLNSGGKTMKDPIQTERDAQRVMLVNLITLPLTFLLVAMGYALAQPVGNVRSLSLGLLIFSGFFNVGTIWLIRRGMGHGLRLTRIYVNLAVNAALVYLLGQHWQPMWMILALMPVSAAIYGTRLQTLVSCIQSCTVILLIQLLFRHHSVMEWGEAFSRVFFVATMSFLINESMRVGQPHAPKS